MATPITPDAAANALEKTLETDAGSDATSLNEKNEHKSISSHKVEKKDKKAKKEKKSKKKKGEEGDVEIDAPAAPKPASFMEMWKYATRFELILNAIGLVFACGSGATQPLLSLIFGRMVTTMTTFSQRSIQYQADPTNPVIQQQFDSAVDDLNDQVSMNCIYLVVIGVAMFIGTYTYTYIFTFTSEKIARR